jgi:hypothetical protein
MQSPVMKAIEIKINGSVGSRIARRLANMDKLHLKMSAR